MARIRPAVAEDRHFLEQMLVLAAHWRPGARARPIHDALKDPKLAHYVAGWPRPDDFGVIAEDQSGIPVGAAWCRHFAVEDPGYGFVSVEVPEVSIAVVATRRGEGIGRHLMLALIDEARRRDVGQLSLSVEVDNFARGLYASVGFTEVAEADGSVTMLLTLH